MTNDSPSHGKTIQEERAAFQADFGLAAAAQEDAECLTPEEILSLQTGAELDPVANEHLTHCSVCSALKQAIQVDPGRFQEFQQTVRETEPVHPARRDWQPSPLGWRLPTAVATAFASFAMLMLIPKYAAVMPVANNVAQARLTKALPPLQIPNAHANDSIQSSKVVQMALQPPSGPALHFVSTAPTTVKDVAPQVATAAVLSKSAISLPLSASPTLKADLEQEASDIVYRWLASAVADKASFTNSERVVYLPAEKSYQLNLSVGNAFVTVPEVALEDGRTIKTQMLSNTHLHQAIAALSDENRPVNVSMKLTDGFVITIDSAKSQAQKTASDHP